MTLRERLLEEALCNFTPDLVGGKCGDCKKPLAETESVYWFADKRDPALGRYVGPCCAKKRLK